ncbi:MAG: CinA family protein, partial [Rhodospirillales bacterium]
MFTDPQTAAAEALLEACRREGLKLATAESCTGGLIAGL